MKNLFPDKFSLLETRMNKEELEDGFYSDGDPFEDFEFGDDEIDLDFLQELFEEGLISEDELNDYMEGLNE